MPKTGDSERAKANERAAGSAPSASRLSDRLRAERRPFEPVADAQILAAIERAERHHGPGHQAGVLRSTLAEHLGFVHNSWTTRRLRPQIDALRSAGLLRDVRRHGLDLLVLTSVGRRSLTKARKSGMVVLVESPQHRFWRHSRAVSGERIDGFRQRLRVTLAEARALLDAAEVSSDEWFKLAPRLERDCSRLGSATYCLREWPEPDDARADVDDGEFRGRRNVWRWDGT
jgi:hypothetical protein